MEASFAIVDDFILRYCDDKTVPKGSTEPARREQALYVLRQCIMVSDSEQMSVVPAAFCVAMHTCDAAHSNDVLNGACSAARWCGRNLLLCFLGDVITGQPSVWDQHEEAHSTLFPGEEIDDESDMYIAGERACALVHNHCMSAVMAALWHLTDPANGYAVPSPQDVVAAAARVRGIVDVILPNDAIRRFARWELSDDACDYLRAEFGHDELQELGDCDEIDGVRLYSLTCFLLAVRFMRMAIRRARALSAFFVAWFMCDIISPGETSLVDERQWDYGGEWVDQRGMDWSTYSADEALATHAHACMLPRLTRISDTGQMFPLMYLMRYRTIACELAWIRRCPAVFMRRAVIISSTAAAGF